jgi:hypothetical protein
MANDRLDFLTKQVVSFEQKIKEHGQAVMRLKERITETRKEIFDLDEGRFLEAAHRVAVAHPEFEELVRREREKIELQKNIPDPGKPIAAKRGRPSKAKAPAAPADQLAEPDNPAPITLKSAKKESGRI